MNFVPEQETFTSIPVWIRIYSLPLDYWMPESLKAIGNKLGHFLKISEATLRGKYTSYACICVEMDLSGALPDEVILEVYDDKWVQTVDYEHITFRCHKCHEHGHLSRVCPLNKREEYLNTSKGKDQKGFTKVGGKGKGGGRKTQKNPTENDNKTRSYNSFEILGEKEVDGGDQKSTENQAARGKGKETSMEFTQEQNEHTMDPLTTMEIEKDHEMTQSESGTEDQDLQEILERENLELEKFLEQGGNLGINSIHQEDVDKVQQIFLNKAHQTAAGVKRGHDNQENKGTSSIGSITGKLRKNPGKKRGRKRQKELLLECGKLMIDSGRMKDLSSYSFKTPPQ